MVFKVSTNNMTSHITHSKISRWYYGDVER